MRTIHEKRLLDQSLKNFGKAGIKIYIEQLKP